MHKLPLTKIQTEILRNLVQEGDAAEARKKISEETPILTYLVAETVCERAAIPNAANYAKRLEIEAEEKFASNSAFRAAVKGPENTGRDFLVHYFNVRLTQILALEKRLST